MYLLPLSFWKAEHPWCSSGGSQAPRGPFHPQHDGKHCFFSFLHKSSGHLGAWNDSLSQLLSLPSDLHSPWGPGPGSSKRGALNLAWQCEKRESFCSKHWGIFAGPHQTPAFVISRNACWTMFAALPAGPNEKCHLVFLQRMSLTHQWQPEAYRWAKQNICGPMS